MHVDVDVVVDIYVYVDEYVLARGFHVRTPLSPGRTWSRRGAGWTSSRWAPHRPL